MVIGCKQADVYFGGVEMKLYFSSADCWEVKSYRVDCEGTFLDSCLKYGIIESKEGDYDIATLFQYWAHDSDVDLEIEYLAEKDVAENKYYPSDDDY